MSAFGTSALVIRDLQLNYLWPQYSLPWNNFFGRVQPNPFYLQNQLRNITIREVHSPLTFRSLPVIATGDGLGRDDLSVPNWVEIDPFHSTVQNSTAVKVFVGPYVDIRKDITGLEYQYDYTGNVILSKEHDIDGFVYLVVNLNNNNPTTVNFPAYVQTPGDYDGRHDTCHVGDHAGNFSTLTGSIIIKSRGSSCTGKDDKSLCLDNAIPIGPCAANCRPKTLHEAHAFYYINGNRLYIAARTGAGCHDHSDKDSDAGSHSSGKCHTHYKFHLSYAVTIRVVETTTPLYKALDPFLDPFAAIL